RSHARRSPSIVRSRSASPGGSASAPALSRTWRTSSSAGTGTGFPGAAAGEAIAPPARVLHVARDISVFLSAAGPDRAGEVIEQRAGGAYDPHLAALAIDHLDELLDGLDDALIWDQAIAAEPPPQRWLTGDG